jgi:hypothetical protein
MSIRQLRQYASRTRASTSHAGRRPGCLGRLFPQTGGLPIPITVLVGAPFEGANAKSWFLAVMQLLRHEERTVAVAARCIQAIVASNAMTKNFPEDMMDLEALTFLVNPPRGLDHAVCDVDGLRANDGLLVFVNLLEDLATPLRASDALSAQIERIVGEVVPWLFPPWELRGRVVPAVREALVDARAFVCALADGQAQVNERPSMDSTRRTTVAAASGLVHFPSSSRKFVRLLLLLVTNHGIWYVTDWGHSRRKFG